MDTSDFLKKIVPGFVRRHRKLLVFLFCVLFAFVATLLSVNFYFENYGVPIFLREKIKAVLAEEDILFDSRTFRVGIFKGAVLEDLHIRGPNKYEYPELYAEKFLIRFAPSEIFKGTFVPLNFEIVKGSLDIPLFPESGIEGAGDIISIRDFNADMGGAPGLIVVHKAEGKIQEMEFSVSGTIDNLLHAAGAHGGEVLRDRLMEKNDGKNASPVNSRQTVLKSIQSAFSTKIPVSMRRNFVFAFSSVCRETFSSPPRCTASFAIDIKDFKRTVVDAEIELPGFNYGHLSVGSLKQGLQLRDGIFSFNGFIVELGDDEYIKADGRYDGQTGGASGEIKGVCSAEKIMLFLDEETRRSVTEKIVFKPGVKLAFDGLLQNFSFSTGHYMGAAEITIPEMCFNGIDMKNVDLDLNINEQGISGDVMSAELIASGEVSGSFRIKGGSFECDVEGTALPVSLKRFFSPEAASFLERNIAFLNDSEKITFSGDISSENWLKSDFTGEMDILVPGMKWKGLAIKNLTGKLKFTADTLNTSNIEAEIDKDTIFTGEILCLLKSKTISASVICKGSLEKAVSILDPEHKSFINSLTREIKWPQKGNLIESNADIHISYGNKPFYFLSGTLVMTDFEYRGIRFNYGATRFFIDSNKLMILPGAVLETKDGQAVMSVSYKGIHSSGNDSANTSAEPEGRLRFSLESTIAGNHIMRCLYPEWKSEFIDFPKSVKVTSKGLIDYKNPEKSNFKAEIGNGKCLWKGIEIGDLDAFVTYADRRLEIRKAGASICEGRVDMDFDFDFKSMTGNIDGKLSDADLLTVLKGLKCVGVAAGETKKAKLAGALKSSIYYGADGLLRMNGAGNMKITGSDLWTIPVMGEFVNFLGRAWSMDKVGTITNMDCDFDLVGDRLMLKSFKSDGGFVALSAKGDYFWNTNEFDIKFRAELLKSALPFETMSTVLSPVSWMLDRRLKGKLDSYKWE